jgi:hypothetical protein
MPLYLTLRHIHGTEAQQQQRNRSDIDAFLKSIDQIIVIHQNQYFSRQINADPSVDESFMLYWHRNNQVHQVNLSLQKHRDNHNSHVLTNALLSYTGKSKTR